MTVERETTRLEGAKRERVLGAAKELFSRFGFKKATVDEIAEGAGLSKRTLYEVFESKEALLADLVMAEALSFRKLCLGQMKRLDDPAEKLRLLCVLSRQYFDENPFLGQVLADDAGLYAPFLGNEIHRVEAGIQDIIAGLLKEGMQKRRFRTLDVEPTARCILVLFRGFTYRRAADEAADLAWVDFILRAIAPDAA